MALFTRITATKHLPAIGSRESPFLEFKGGVVAAQRFELAKDVGAMASAYGGTILVGAVTDQTTEALTAYRAIQDQEAAATIRAYEEAVRDRCSPVPLLDQVRIEHPDGGGVVVAVNVVPVVDQPVGVRVKGDTADGYGGDAYVFHVRLSTHAIPLRSHQLAMFMNPQVRRIAILLGEIPPGAEVVFVARNPRNQSNEKPSEYPAMNVAVQMMRNVVEAELKSQGAPIVRIPLDDIEMVWNDGRAWFVMVLGFFETNAGTRYITNPKNAVWKV